MLFRKCWVAVLIWGITGGKMLIRCFVSVNCCLEIFSLTMLLWGITGGKIRICCFARVKC